jgi:hypothetical protein
MKKLTLTMILISSFATIMYAQIPVQQTVDVKLEQVPLSVKNAFEKDFDLLPTDGSWKVHLTRTNQAGKTITEAEWYSFAVGNKKDKKEVRYSPSGVLMLNKGMSQKNQPTSAASGRIQKD